MPPEENFEANELSQLASSYKINTSTLKRLIELKGQCTPFHEREVCLLSQYSPSDWRRPIVKFLKNPNAGIDKKQKVGL